MDNVSAGMSDSSESCGKNSEEVESSEDNCNGDSNNKSEDESKEASASNKYGSNILTPSSFVLRTSKLNAGLGSLPLTPSKPFVLNPPRLSNPFTIPDKEPESKQSDNNICSTPKTSQKEDKLFTPLNKSSVSFLPLGGEASTPSQPSSFGTPSTPSLGFVFGQNIHEKVEAAAAAAECSNKKAEEPTSNDTPGTTTNGTSELLFSVKVPKENSEKNSEASKSLSEAAREYEESRAVKRTFEEVAVVTGEEEEANVLQMNCKLFSWSNCSWIELGRGILRVNDLTTTPSSHRLIVRATGSLRVVLNTKIWSGMTVDRASPKSLRITGMDSSGIVKVFLVMASPKEMDQLQKCLEWRVNNLKKSDEVSPKKIKQDEDS